MPDGSEVRDVPEGDDLDKELEAFAGEELDQLIDEMIEKTPEKIFPLNLPVLKYYISYLKK